ncbi:MAG: TolC family protein [Colwellia sp.]|nr:TolC family protein [Colwellia sp.]
MTFFSVKSTGIVLCTAMSMTWSVNGFAYESNYLSSTWLNSQINKHPDIVAACEAMNAVFSRAQGSKLPLYNPELNTGFEREGTANNFHMGINQTIDLWDKREVKAAQGNFALTAASKRFTYSVAEKTAQALQALINWQSAKSKASLAFEQEKQLEILLDIVTKRQKSGNLSPVDAELTFFNLSQLLSQMAQIQVQLKQSEAQVKELLPDWLSEQQLYPELGLGVSNFQVSPQWITQHPLVLEAQAQWNIQKSAAQYALLATKADPTIGLSVGRSNRENVVGVTFSIPLNIRNDYSANAKAESQQAISAEARFHAVFRKQQFLVQANTDALVFNKSYLQRWQKLMKGRAENSAKLLQRQWQIGDLNTADYLLALQQRTEGLYAGIDLKTQFKLSEVAWLLSVGQLSLATKQLN